MKRNALVTIVALLALLISTQVGNAGAVIPFTLNGTTNNIDSFVFNTGNTVAHNAIPLTPFAPFNFYYQSSVSSAQLNGNTVVYPTLNSSTWITVVLGATEEATQVLSDTHGNRSASFQLAPNATVNYVNLYASPTKPNEEAGTGYNAPAGSTLILSAKLTIDSGSFTSNVNNTVPFQSTVNNPTYAGTTKALQNPTSFTGAPSNTPANGSFNLTAAVTFANSSYFTLAPGVHINFTLLSGTAIDQFSRITPTNQFVTSGPDGTVKPTLGTTNGLTGPDLLLQTDGSESFSVTPEPSSMVLGLIGFSGFALAYRKRRSAQVV